MKYNRNLISGSLLFVSLGATGLVAAGADDSVELAKSLGISFSNGTGSTLILERDGKRYQVDVATMTVQAIAPGAEGQAADLFRRDCAVCHGPGGKGVAALQTPDFANPALQRSLSAQDITDAIRNGKAEGRMPAWSGKLSDALGLSPELRQTVKRLVTAR
jgi:cytochrome c553